MSFVSNSQLKRFAGDVKDAVERGAIVSAKSLLTDNFDTKMVLNDKSAFEFRPTATMGSMELEVGSPCKVKGVVGGSLGWNQIIPDISIRVVSSEAYNWSQLQGGFFAVETNHVYLAVLNGKTVEGGAIRFRNIQDNWLYNGGTGYYCIYKSEHTSVNTVLQGFWGEGDTDAYQNVYDLTAMFGATIADYIYTLEQTNAGDGVAWFKRYFPKDYYAYKAIDGSLVNVATSGKKYTKFNQWDEQWEIGAINDATGLPTPGTGNSTRSKNFNRCVPLAIYYVKAGTRTDLCWYDANQNFIQKDKVTQNTTRTAPSNACFFKLTFPSTTSPSEITVSFHYDGERDGEYEPYSSTTIPMDDDELIGIPKLDANGNLCFDGNVYNPDGSVDESKGIVDLGTLQWNAQQVAGAFYAHLPGVKIPTSENINNGYLFSSKFTYNYVALSYMNDYDIRFDSINSDVIDGKLSSASTAEEFKAAISGVYLVYEKATATTGTARMPYAETQTVDNWGTEEFLPPESDTRPIVVPVGHDTDYLPDYKAKMEVAADMPGEDGVYVLKHDESAEGNANQFVPASEITTPINNRVDITLENISGLMRHVLVDEATAGGRTLAFADTAWVDLGTLTWTKASNGNRFSAYIVDLKIAETGSVIPNIVCSKYATDTPNNVFNLVNDKAVSISTSDHYVWVYDNGYTDETTFKAAMKGILLAYEKAST